VPSRSRDLARAADDAAFARSDVFTTVRFVGRSGYDHGPVSPGSIWDRREFSAASHGSREAALAAALADRALGTTDGRGVFLYCVTPTGMTVHLEDRHFHDPVNGARR